MLLCKLHPKTNLQGLERRESRFRAKISCHLCTAPVDPAEGALSPFLPVAKREEGERSKHANVWQIDIQGVKKNPEKTKPRFEHFDFPAEKGLFFIIYSNQHEIKCKRCAS